MVVDPEPSPITGQGEAAGDASGCKPTYPPCKLETQRGDTAPPNRGHPTSSAPCPYSPACRSRRRPPGSACGGAAGRAPPRSEGTRSCCPGTASRGAPAAWPPGSAAWRCTCQAAPSTCSRGAAGAASAAACQCTRAAGPAASAPAKRPRPAGNKGPLDQVPKLSGSSKSYTRHPDLQYKNAPRQVVGCRIASTNSTTL